MLEEDALICVMELFSIGIPFKIKINLFKVLLSLKTLLIPRISFIAFPKPEYINIFTSV